MPRVVPRLAVEFAFVVLRAEFHEAVLGLHRRAQHPPMVLGALALEQILLVADDRGDHLRQLLLAQHGVVHIRLWDDTLALLHVRDELLEHHHVLLGQPLDHDG